MERVTQNQTRRGKTLDAIRGFLLLKYPRRGRWFETSRQQIQQLTRARAPPAAQSRTFKSCIWSDQQVYFGILPREAGSLTTWWRRYIPLWFELISQKVASAARGMSLRQWTIGFPCIWTSTCMEAKELLPLGQKKSQHCLFWRYGSLPIDLRGLSPLHRVWSPALVRYCGALLCCWKQRLRGMEAMTVGIVEATSFNWDLLFNRYPHRHWRRITMAIGVRKNCGFCDI